MTKPGTVTEVEIEVPPVVTRELVYAIADAFGKLFTKMTPRQVYDRIEHSDRPYFKVLRDVVLPYLTGAGMLSRIDYGDDHVQYQFVKPAPRIP